MAPRTEKPKPQAGSAEAEGKTTETQRAARTQKVGQEAIADSHPTSALAQTSPVPPRAEGSGTVVTTTAPDVDYNDPKFQANPDKEKPTEMSNLTDAQKGTAPKLGYLPNQALIAQEETSIGGQLSTIATASQPYGSEPRNVDTETGIAVQPAPVSGKAAETEQGGEDEDPVDPKA